MPIKFVKLIKFALTYLKTRFNIKFQYLLGGRVPVFNPIPVQDFLNRGEIYLLAKSLEIINFKDKTNLSTT